MSGREVETIDGVRYLKKRFAAQPDISSYELAYILSKVRLLSGKIVFTEGNWDKLDQKYKRHFVDWVD